MAELLNYTLIADTDSEVDVENYEIVEVDIELLGVTTRIREAEDVGSLAASIEKMGLLQPIVVATSNGKAYTLIDGARRLKACEQLEMEKVPCLLVKNVKPTDVPTISPIYNHGEPYTNKAIEIYVDYCLKERPMTNAELEHIIGLDEGDILKLLDLKEDNDPEILDKFRDGELSIQGAHKKLESRRKKESKLEKSRAQAMKVYGTQIPQGSGVEELEGIAGSERMESGVSFADSSGFSDEAFAQSGYDDPVYTNKSYGDGGGYNGVNPGPVLAFDPEECKALESEEVNLSDMVKEADEIEGFKASKSAKAVKVEKVDNNIKKSTFARDENTCQCCGAGGATYEGTLEYHYIVPIDMGGVESVSNGTTLCMTCHRLVHLFGLGQLEVPETKGEEEIAELSVEDKVLYESGQKKFKKVVYYGTHIRRLIGVQRTSK